MLFGCLLHGTRAASPRDRRARRGWRFQSSRGAAPVRERERAGRVSDKLEHVGGAGASATSEGGRTVCTRAEACQQLRLSLRPTQRAVTRSALLRAMLPALALSAPFSPIGSASLLRFHRFALLRFHRLPLLHFHRFTAYVHTIGSGWSGLLFSQLGPPW